MKDSQEALDALADDVGSVSDGFHTFDELYRAAYDRVGHGRKA